ncbi:MAG: UDP-glucose--hexose-1-phosphate uridylyltransferase [Clostridiales bacterium]|jgi:UDPglucose--hexose-1-phosphate uridylyltransferase|nr:UDP-glucose--hexose-1-phosphate uridylyltransferase [Clostridiales bacterium]
MASNSESLQNIENLLSFALRKGLIENNDKNWARNALLDILSLDPGEDIYEADERALTEDVYDILSGILNLHAKTPVQKDLLDARIMGILTPRPSEVERKFREDSLESIEAATNAFYALCQNNHYIQMNGIRKNLYWIADTQFGNLEITINLSKPEKDPRDIAAAKSLAQTNYPKCLLCKENVGFAGRFNHPARQNLRLIPIDLGSETWYFQYSPYVYYNEHCIVLSSRHVPMKMNEETFRRLLGFIEKFPHYFIGSNADIPIVGGSILSHDHFQGGRHAFPMEKAESYAFYSHKSFLDARISLLNWPMSAIRAADGDKERLIALCMLIMNKWKNYSDEGANIRAYTGDTPHNALTPIARIGNDGLWEIDLVLRNNRTTDEFPLGIFHPHQDLHHIKKENIGLIEVMGLAVLPGRLKQEMDGMALWLMGEKADDSALSPHLEWLAGIREKCGGALELKEANEVLKKEIGLVFERVLRDAGVYKFDDAGKAAFHNFMLFCGFEGK